MSPIRLPMEAGASYINAATDIELFYISTCCSSKMKENKPVTINL